MATSVKYPQSNDASSWTNPTNVYADDGSYATAAPAQNDNVSGYWYNFDFGIPAGSQINIIDVEVKWKVSTIASVHTFGISVLKNGALYSSTEMIVTTEPVLDRTDNKNTLNGVWTASTINGNTANDFAVRLRSIRGNSATAVTCSVDYIKVTVTYETSPTPIELSQDASEVDAVGTAALVSVTTGHLSDVVEAIGTAELVDIYASGAIGTAELMAYVDITKAFLHDASGSYTDYTIPANEDTIDDVAMLPASIGANDAFYFLIGAYGASSPKVYGLRIDVTTVGDGTYTLLWEYYNGADWVSLDDYIIAFGGAYDYKAIDISSNKLDAYVPSDISDVVVNSISGKWIRARYDSGTLTQQPLVKRIYTYEAADYEVVVPETILPIISANGIIHDVQHRIIRG